VSGARSAACPECLRRAWLVGSLSGHIEKAAADAPGSRAHELLALSDERLVRAVARARAGSILRGAADRDPRRLLEAVAGAGAWACCRHDGRYPSGLADLRDAPAVLFGRGDPALLGELVPDGAVTIVGTRRPSGYGRELATSLAREVAAAGVGVVSGMALGIDSRAHAGALEAGGFTVAVLGNGVDIAYPASSRQLYAQIAERGLVISELPPGTAARRWSFPARNRIMAALSAMTVVVEAREPSGSLITAEFAQELGRQLGAVPGRVGTSSAAGTNGLLRDGAAVIRGAGDVLDALLPIGAEARRGAFSPRGPALDAGLGRVLELVEGGAGTPDALARASGLEPGALASALVQLELSGYLRSDTAGRYERTPLEAPEHP